MDFIKKTFNFNSYVRYCETATSSTCDSGQPTDPAFVESGYVALLRLYKLTDYSFEFTFIAAPTAWDESQYDVAAIKLLNEEPGSGEMDAVKVNYPSIDTSLDTVGKVLIHKEDSGDKTGAILTVQIRISDSSTPIKVLKQQALSGGGLDYGWWTN